jgi:hypothetical protein
MVRSARMCSAIPANQAAYSDHSVAVTGPNTVATPPILAALQLATRSPDFRGALQGGAIFSEHPAGSRFALMRSAKECGLSGNIGVDFTIKINGAPVLCATDLQLLAPLSAHDLGAKSVAFSRLFLGLNLAQNLD